MISGGFAHRPLPVVEEASCHGDYGSAKLKLVPTQPNLPVALNAFGNHRVRFHPSRLDAGLFERLSLQSLEPAPEEVAAKRQCFLDEGRWSRGHVDVSAEVREVRSRRSSGLVLVSLNVVVGAVGSKFDRMKVSAAGVLGLSERETYQASFIEIRTFFKNINEYDDHGETISTITLYF